jgi:ATP-dependent exoDNAse (exonuclease V) alpha subunit
MAIFHYSQKPVARSRGQSAVAGAAYRAADKLYDHRVGQWFDYERRGGVVHAEIVLPTEAAKRDIHWARNRQQLWNAAEAAEHRKDSRVAREHEVALPHELQKEQHIALLRAFAGEIANRYQVAVDFALHKPHRQGDARNFHAHVYATTRQVGPTGLGDKASIELSNTDRAKRGLVASKVEIIAMRARWGELVNEHLALQGIEARVDHRSLKAQGVERTPTTHLGPAVTGMERRGIDTRVGLRVGEQQRLEVQARPERAAELGRLARERSQIEKSIVDLSGDLAVARRQLELQRPKESLEEIQSKAVENWLAFRASQKDGNLSSEERQQQAVERWLEYRRTQGLGADSERDVDQEADKSREKDLDHGIDDDWGW